MRINIDAILNIEDEVVIGGKTFKIREFTLKERLQFSKILMDQADIVTKQIKNPKKLLNSFMEKDVSDYALLKYVFDVCQNKDPEFTEKDFDKLTPTQIKTITNLVFKKNDFFQPRKKEEES